MALEYLLAFGISGQDQAIKIIDFEISSDEFDIERQKIHLAQIMKYSHQHIV